MILETDSHKMFLEGVAILMVLYHVKEKIPTAHLSCEDFYVQIRILTILLVVNLLDSYLLLPGKEYLLERE